MKEEIKKAIWLFVAPAYQDRRNLKVPNKFEEYYFATDTFCMATTKRENVSEAAFEIASPFDSPNGIATIIREGERNVFRRLSVSEIRNLLREIPKTREKVKDRLCPECEGEWNTVCRCCDQEVECDCEDGWIYKPGEFTEEFASQNSCRIGEAFLNPKFVRKLTDVATILNEPFVEHIRDLKMETDEGVTTSGAQEFRIGPVRVTIMPFRVPRGLTEHDGYKITNVPYMSE